MSTLTVVEVPTTGLAIDARFPEREEGFIYEHLRYYCSKFDPLPAVMANVEGDEAYVTRGHQYFRIAKDLKRPTIRAVLSGDGAVVSMWISKHRAVMVDWELEARVSRREAWHVFFFARPLTLDEQGAFALEIGAVFRDLGGNTEVQGPRFSHQDAAAEMAVTTSAALEPIAGRLLEACRAFSSERAPILSFQGRRFQ